MTSATKRKAISKRVRFEIFKRDSFTCQYCGAHPPQVILHLDHIVPVAEGGGNSPDNLITSCEPCNLGKGATSLGDIPQSLADRAKEVAEREEQIRGYNEIMQAKADRIEQEAWEVAAKIEGVEELESYSRQNLMSIKRFLDRLPFYEVAYAAEITRAKFRYIGASAFKYFCGICWSKIREIEGGTR